jgi:hypothetical protein
MIDMLDAAYVALISSYKGTTGFAVGRVTSVYFDTKLELHGRLLEKIRQLIEKYKYQEDKFLPVASAWIITRMASLGLDMNKKVSQSAYMSQWDKSAMTSQWADAEMKTWARKVWDELMTDVIEKHDLRQANHLGSFAVVAMITVGDFGQKQYEEMIANALTFKVEWTMDIIADGGNADYGFLHTVAKCDEAAISLRTYEDILFIGYTGSASYIGERGVEENKSVFWQYESYEFSKPEEQRQMIENPKNECWICLYNMDPCERKNITIGLFPAYSSQPTIRVNNGGEIHDERMLGVATLSTFDNIYKKYWKINERIGAFYFMEMELRNERADCAAISIKDKVDEYGGTASITWDISLTHAPKGKVYFEKPDLPGGSTGGNANNGAGFDINAGGIVGGGEPQESPSVTNGQTAWPMDFLPSKMPIYPDGTMYVETAISGDVLIKITSTSFKSLINYIKVLNDAGWNVELDDSYMEDYLKEYGYCTAYGKRGNWIFNASYNADSSLTLAFYADVG